jgi:hypothetical protein
VLTSWITWNSSKVTSAPGQVLGDPGAVAGGHTDAHRADVLIKDLWIFPLDRRFRETLAC